MKDANMMNDDGAAKVRATSRKQAMKVLAPVLLGIFLSGCGTGYSFNPYIGQQQNWQTQPGGYVKIVDKATLYPPGQLPNRPYLIIGSVVTGSEGNLAKAVREQHADAALIYSDHTYRTGTVAVASPGIIWGMPLTHTDIAAQLIKFR
jgi:hypothetical protein